MLPIVFLCNFLCRLIFFQREMHFFKCGKPIKMLVNTRNRIKNCNIWISVKIWMWPPYRYRVQKALVSLGLLLELSKYWASLSDLYTHLILLCSSFNPFLSASSNSPFSLAFPFCLTQKLQAAEESLFLHETTGCAWHWVITLDT